MEEKVVCSHAKKCANICNHHVPHTETCGLKTMHCRDPEYCDLVHEQVRCVPINDSGRCKSLWG